MNLSLKTQFLNQIIAFTKTSLEIANKWPLGALQSTRKTQFAADARFRFQFKYYGGKNVSTVGGGLEESGQRLLFTICTFKSSNVDKD